jgi:hypothetical protein
MRLYLIHMEERESRSRDDEKSRRLFVTRSGHEDNFAIKHNGKYRKQCLLPYARDPTPQKRTKNKNARQDPKLSNQLRHAFGYHKKPPSCSFMLLRCFCIFLILTLCGGRPYVHRASSDVNAVMRIESCDVMMV